MAKKKHQARQSGDLPFSVDSALLAELGERLVGKAHIALAELVKNSFDADATKVEIEFSDDQLVITDNGNGMNFVTFRDFWMRIGSPHKQRMRVSERFGRPLTGSKGVGRLAVQFLASKIEITTRASGPRQKELVATVDWTKAVRAGELTHAVANYQQRKPSGLYPDNSQTGTRIVLSNLKQSWGRGELVDLAQEIWWLRPPFESVPSKDKGGQFNVEVSTPDPEAASRFNQQMTAYLNIWYARISGKLDRKPGQSKNGDATVKIAIEFSDGQKNVQTHTVKDCPIRELDFEIRVYHLRRRQKHRIRVDEAREYFNKYGGVHVYDAGFHLPYYGPDTDWLNIEMDHSHRLSKSKLLPEALQVQGGMEYLPTQSRLLGVVNVNTSAERAAARRKSAEDNYLAIQISRDRLVDNRAYQTLRNIVRWSLDYYAQNAAKRSIEEAESLRLTAHPIDRIASVEDVLERYESDIPEPVYKRLRTEVATAVEAIETEAQAVQAQVGALGALATAGMSALAYQHEINKQFGLLDRIIAKIQSIETGARDAGPGLDELATEITQWLDRARATYGLFSYLLDTENTSERRRLKAASVIKEVERQTMPLMQKIEIQFEQVESSLRLPLASFAEWSAILQNVFVNAANAMVDSKTRKLKVASKKAGRRHRLTIEDTGIGVDVETADELFEPFTRRLELTKERKALGLGGSGLGLTIVRMIANNIGCRVRFVKPSDDFNTAFELSWRD